MGVFEKEIGKVTVFSTLKVPQQIIKLLKLLISYGDKMSIYIRRFYYFNLCAFDAFNSAITSIIIP